MALSPGSNERKKREMITAEQRFRRRNEIIQRLKDPETAKAVDEIIKRKKHPDEIHLLLETNNFLGKNILDELKEQGHTMASKIDRHEIDFIRLNSQIKEMKLKLARDRMNAKETGDRRTIVETTKKEIMLKQALKNKDYAAVDRLINGG